MGKRDVTHRPFLRLTLLSLILSTLSIQPANAATVIATGTNPSVCNQTVDNDLNVIAYRLSGGNCVVEFKNTGTVIWTVPAGVNSVQVLTVGGGGAGGGGSRATVDGYRGSAGGGEGGEARYSASSSVTGGATAAVIVGSGGTSGAANNNAGGYGSIGNTGGATSFNGANSAAGGVGGGVMTAESQLGSGGDGGGLIGSCNSSTSQSSAGSSNNYFAGCNDYEGSGGGAGAGGNGGNGSDIGGPGGNGGAGGVGLSSSITDTAIFFGGGGGGGGTSGLTTSLNGSAGAGGNGGGGGGSIYGSPSPATSGTANRGGGGGGGGGYSNATQVATSGGAGGSGIVIVRYAPVPSPINSAAPTISGTTTFGQVLTSTTGTWSNSPTSYTYQWSRAATSGGSYTNISGATSSTYTLVAADVGQYLKSTVTAINASGSAAAISVATAQIAKATPTFSAWSNVTNTFGDGTYTVTAPTVTGSLAGSFGYSSNNTAVISISGSTFTVAGGGAATITATFTPTDSANYNSAATTNTVTVNRAAQSAITITSTAAIYGSNLSLTSSGGSTGGTYIYSKVSGNCTIAGAVLTSTATGSCVIQSSLATTANYLAETSTATTITISSGTAGASLTLGAGDFIFRQAKNITAVSTVAGKITFKVSGKVLPGCKNKVVNAGNSYTATCPYRPSTRSIVMVSATLDPTDSFYLGTVTNSAQFLVKGRTGAR